MTTPFGFGDFGNEFLEQQPRAAFESFGFGQTPAERRFFQSSDTFANVHNQFLASLARDVRSGQTPQGTFAGSFLPSFNPQRFLAETTPAFRGTAPQSRFNPPTRSLFF
tara:strand:- start:1921 stop:2247 length:327 start_codon:yes stop_codon:yes gene_type:complete